MFAKTARNVSLILVLVSCLFFGYTCIGSKRDRDNFLRKYQQKKRETQGLKNCYQLREGVRKDIWFAEENKMRLHNRIESNFSKLTLLPREEKIDIIESMYNIKGWIQEKLYREGPIMSQQLRYFEADHGIYRYIPQTFETGNLSLSLYKLPGNELPSSCNPKDAFLRGVAQEASLKISGKVPLFEAKQFQASVTKAAP